MICRSAVIELRRHAPKFLDRQGQIARILLDNYNGFDVEPSPVRYQEQMGIKDPANRFSAFVSGYLCAANKVGLDDLAQFERDAWVFFKLVEPVVEEEQYERLGILFSFEAEHTEQPEGWYHDQLKISPPENWSMGDMHARYDRGTDLEGDTVIVRRWGHNSDGAAPSNVRIDVDHFRFDVDKLDAWNFDLEPELERAKQSLGQVLHGDI